MLAGNCRDFASEGLANPAKHHPIKTSRQAGDSQRITSHNYVPRASLSPSILLHIASRILSDMRSMTASMTRASGVAM